ncbi:MAG: exo-alpha-sialidase [Opitutaceae bacterium]|nr:exo-alpha-sialidase [Opitutaceae bacterium]
MLRPTLLLLAVASSAGAASFHRDQLAVPAAAKVTVSRDSYPGLINPNPRGGYYKCANVVLARDGSLVACWQFSDNHVSLTSWIMVARSRDGGRTWGEHRAISHSNVWADQWVWVVPQMSVLRDGRIVIVADRGQRNPGQDWPMLANWQKPERGMQNWVFWSSDHGTTWTKGEKIDDVGGEPGYVVELSDGTLAFTRTSSAKTTRLKNPPAPWNDIYYRNEIVLSDDRGKTWGRTAWLADSPFHGDCEVGLAELAPGKLIAATRIGLGNGRFGHPSRLIYSDDHGRTWPRAEPAPFYGQRVHVRKLQSGKLLATFRNNWGSYGTRALVFDPAEKLGFQPQSFILEEERCALAGDALSVRTAEGKRGAVEFSLYPAQDDVSRVEIEATLRVESAQKHAAAISAGVWLRFLPDRVCLADRPAAGFAIDARQWHTYRIVREGGFVTVWVDGAQKLREPVGDLWVRHVRFGNRSTAQGGGAYAENAGVTQWRAVAAKVTNADDTSIDWKWSPRQGYPDQFRRDRITVLDWAYPGDCGYSSWTQLPDGRIVILDYTSAPSLEPFSHGTGTPPIIRAYLVTEGDLVR